MTIRRTILLAAILACAALVGCGRGNDQRCDEAARASAARVAARDGTPGVTTMTDVAAAKVAAVLRTRCRDDGWSARATTCLRDDALACWRDALTSGQADRLDEAVQTAIDELRAPLPPARPAAETLRVRPREP